MAKVWGSGSTRPRFLLEMRGFDLIRSGSHTFNMQGGTSSVTTSEPWQGTIVYLQLHTNKEIDPTVVVANRTNVAEQYNQTFLNDNELEELW